MTNKCLVYNNNLNLLSITSINKGWFLIRQNRAELLNKNPMVIKLVKRIIIE